MVYYQKEGYKMDRKLIEFVYDAMQGEYRSSVNPDIENAFEEGAPCYNWYGKAYDAERRLEDRLGKDSHDDDVECIMCAMTDIQQYLCFKMYEYGAKYGYDWDKVQKKTLQFVPKKEK